MDKHDLIKSAQKLQQPDETAAKEFSQKMDHIVAEVNRQMGQRPDLERLIGQDNVSMMQDNHHNFAHFMESLFYEYRPEVLVETVLWAMRAYLAHGFKLTYWPAELNTFIEVLQQELSADSFQAVYPFYNWITINIPICIKINEE
jgi:hypothetical protein